MSNPTPQARLLADARAALAAIDPAADLRWCCAYQVATDLREQSTRELARMAESGWFPDLSTDEGLAQWLHDEFVCNLFEDIRLTDRYGGDFELDQLAPAEYAAQLAEFVEALVP